MTHIGFSSDIHIVTFGFDAGFDHRFSIYLILQHHNIMMYY